MSELKKRPAPIFKEMNVGQEETFSFDQKDTLETTRTRMQNKYPGRKYSIFKASSLSYKVIRTA